MMKTSHRATGGQEKDSLILSDTKNKHRETISKSLLGNCSQWLT